MLSSKIDTVSSSFEALAYDDGHHGNRKEENPRVPLSSATNTASSHLSGRILGTMVTVGYPTVSLQEDLAIACSLGAACVEILPFWRNLPDPLAVAREIRDQGLIPRSVHGCWGGQAIQAANVDLSHPDPVHWNASIDDLRRSLDWSLAVGAEVLVVHPGGLSLPEQHSARLELLGRGLGILADHASQTGISVCVENMPPGVYPGSRMADLAQLLTSLGRKQLGLILDTGHAQLVSTPEAETLEAVGLLRATHVHDNDGRQDLHWPPGIGSIRWPEWFRALDQVQYSGPIMLECIRAIRRDVEQLAQLREWIERARTD